MSFTWERPSNVPYPNVWKTFEVTLKDGQIRKIRIEDIPPDRFEEVIDFIALNFEHDEPLHRALQLRNDPESVTGSRIFRRELLKQKVSLMATFDEENEQDSKTQIIGALFLNVKSKNDKPLKVTGAQLNKIVDFVHYGEKAFNPFEQLGSDKYMSHFGVAVAPTYYGLGIGLQLELGASFLGKRFGIKGSSLIFTSTYSQPFAEKLGCKLINEVRYNEYKNGNGDMIIPVIDTPSAKFYIWSYT